MSKITQLSLLNPLQIAVNCLDCMDIGHVNGKCCWCKAGCDKRQSLIHDCVGISSGTMAGLIDDSRYSAIQAVQYEFVDWLVRFDDTYFDNWQRAWDHWYKRGPGNNV